MPANTHSVATTTVSEPTARADEEAAVLAACYRIILGVAARKRAAAKADVQDELAQADGNEPDPPDPAPAEPQP